MPGTSFSTLEILLFFMTFLIFGLNISCVNVLVHPVQEDFQEILFDDPERDIFG